MGHLQECALCIMQITKYDAALLAGEMPLKILGEMRLAKIPVTLNMVIAHKEAITKMYTPIQQRKLRVDYINTCGDKEWLENVQLKVKDLQAVTLGTQLDLMQVMWEDVIPKIIEKVHHAVLNADAPIKDLVAILDTLIKTCGSLGEYVQIPEIALKEVYKDEDVLKQNEGHVRKEVEHDLRETLNILKKANASLRGVG